MPDGPHIFFVRATDAVLNVDQTPEGRDFTVDTTAPEPTISPSSPSGTIPNANPSFEFSANEPATFECSLDSAAFTTCTSPKAYAALPDGPPTFAVRATDGVLNVDPTPATRTFTVSATTTAPSPPDTKLYGTATAAKKQKHKGKKILLVVQVAAGEPLTASATGTIKLGTSLVRPDPADPGHRHRLHQRDAETQGQGRQEDRQRPRRRQEGKGDDHRHAHRHDRQQGHPGPQGQAGVDRPGRVTASSVFDDFTLEMVDVGEMTLRVRHGGTGTPVVLLHGHPRTHTTWHAVAPRLAERHTVVCPDLRGYGGSTLPPDAPGPRPVVASARWPATSSR